MNVKSESWQTFLMLCQKAHSVKQLDELFQVLFTASEKDQMALRIELLRELLKKEKTQREISRDLHISIAKITRGSNVLKASDESIKQFLIDHLIDQKSIP